MSTYAGRYDEPLLKIVGRTVTAATTATAEVYKTDGATLATLYTDRTKSVTQANPVSPDGNGNLEFFADPGEYLLKLYEGSTLVRTDTITVHPDTLELDDRLGVLEKVDTSGTVSAAIGNATNPLLRIDGANVGGNHELLTHAATEFFGSDATAHGYLKLYSQIGTGEAGAHDLALVVGGMADIAFRHHVGGTGKLMFEIHGKVPTEMTAGWDIQQGDNSPVVTFPSVGGEVQVHGTLKGTNGANDDLILKIGGAAGQVVVKDDVGGTLFGLSNTGQMTHYVDTATTTAHQVLVPGDTVGRLILRPDRIRMGGGAGVDINLTRVAAGVLRSDARLDLTGKDLLVQQGGTLESTFGSIGGRPGLRFGTGNVTLTVGPGTPEGVITAPVASVHLRTDGGASTTIYVKESGVGNTGWTAK